MIKIVFVAGLVTVKDGNYLPQVGVSPAHRVGVFRVH